MPAVHPADEKQKVHPLGPIPPRKCRDVFFLLIFIIFWIGMFVIFAFSVKYGDIQRLRYGTDNHGNLCGTNNLGAFTGAIDATSLPLLYYTQPWSPNGNGTTLCVAECPKVNGNSGTLLCDYGVAPSASAVSAGKCYYPFASQPVLNRCIPNAFVQFDSNGNIVPSSDTSSNSKNSNANSDLDGRNVAAQIWSDVAVTWKIILICCCVAIILSFVWLMVIRWFATFVVWVTILISTTGIWAITGYMWYSWYCAVKNINPGIVLYSGNSQIDSAVYNQSTLLALGIIFACIAIPLTIFVIAARKRIRLAISVIGEASKALRSMPSLLLLPIIKNVILAGVFGFCLWVLLLLASSGTNIAAEVNTSQSEQTGQKFQPSTILNFLQIYYVFGLFWSWWLLIAVLQTTIAGAVGAWYWSLDKSSSGLPKHVILKSFGRVIRYHLGSLAFGSLILAITSTIRVLLAYASHQASKAPNSKLLKMVLGCLQCCLACFEQFVKFLNTNAYIEVAVYGTSFMTSAKRAFDLLWRNAFRVAVISSVSGIILFLGKIMIMVITGVFCMLMVQSPSFMAATGEDLSGRYWSVTLIIVLLLAYMIGASFTAVLQMTIDTVFLCFCEDSEKNDGSADKPYYMPSSLRALISGNSISQVPSKIVVHNDTETKQVTQSKAYY